MKNTNWITELVGRFLAFLYLIYWCIIGVIADISRKLRKGKKRIDVERYVYPPKD